MSSLSMPEQKHRRSPLETVKMASDEPQPLLLLPGLGDPTPARSDAATTMATGGGAGDEEEMMGAEVPRDCDVVLIGDGVVFAPTPLSIMKQSEVSAPPLLPHAAPSATKQCVQCGATETPQWRFQPTGRGVLCNACRIRLRPAEALLEPVHVRLQPAPASAGGGNDDAGRLRVSGGRLDLGGLDGIRRGPAEGGLSQAGPREKSPSPLPAPAPEEEKELKRKKQPWYPPRSSRRCHHCNSVSTPQWRTGPAGPSTLCNACGVRFAQGRLLPEYRPVASPNFKASEHSCKHSEVLELRQKKKKDMGKKHHQPPKPGAGDGMEQHLPPPPAQAHAGDELPTEPNPLGQLLLDAIDGSPEAHIVYGGGGGGLQMGDPSSLDQFLFNGPVAPLLVDDDDDDKDLAE